MDENNDSIRKIPVRKDENKKLVFWEIKEIQLWGT
jgi:hypothetical protein